MSQEIITLKARVPEAVINAAGTVVTIRLADRDDLRDHRGALRFRDAAAALRAPLNYPERRKQRRLPRSRSFTERPYCRPFSKKELRTATGSEWDAVTAPRPARARRLVTFAAATLAAGAAAVYATVWPAQKGPAAAFVAPLSPIETAEQLVFDSRPAVEATLRGFHAAQTAEEKVRFIRGGERLLPLLRGYYESHPDEPALARVHHDTANWVEVNGRLVVYGLHETTDGMLHQYAVELEQGRCLLDWRSLTGWTGREWSGYLTQRPAGPHTFCISAVPDTLYTGAFADAAAWLCLRLEDITRSRAAWAYVRRDSEAARALPPEFLLNEPGHQAPQRLTLTLQFPDVPHPGSAANVAQLETCAVVTKGWFDARLQHSPSRE